MDQISAGRYRAAHDQEDHMTDTPDVRVGQIWADNDPRSAGRYVIVEAVNDTHAMVAQCGPHGTIHQKARRTEIRLTRMRPTSNGYRLERDA